MRSGRGRLPPQISLWQLLLLTAFIVMAVTLYLNRGGSCKAQPIEMSAASPQVIPVNLTSDNISYAGAAPLQQARNAYAFYATDDQVERTYLTEQGRFWQSVCSARQAGVSS